MAELKGVEGGVSGLKPRCKRRGESPGRQVLKKRRSPRRRGRMGTSRVHALVAFHRVLNRVVRLFDVRLQRRHRSAQRQQTLEPGFALRALDLQLVRDGIQTVLREKLHPAQFLVVIPRRLVQDALERSQREVVHRDRGLVQLGVRVVRVRDGARGGDRAGERARGRAGARRGGNGVSSAHRARDRDRRGFRGRAVRVHEHRAVRADDRAEGLEPDDEHAVPATRLTNGWMGFGDET
eukprot:29786-Pelagococcus_subviridis.AAC.4